MKSRIPVRHSVPAKAECIPVQMSAPDALRSRVSAWNRHYWLALSEANTHAAAVRYANLMTTPIKHPVSMSQNNIETVRAAIDAILELEGTVYHNGLPDDMLRSLSRLRSKESELLEPIQNELEQRIYRGEADATDGDSVQTMRDFQ